MGTLRDLAAKSTFLKRERSEPLGRGNPKLMSEMAFSHSVSPSGPVPPDSRSALCRFSLLRCPFVVLRFWRQTHSRQQPDVSLQHPICMLLGMCTARDACAGPSPTFARQSHGDLWIAVSTFALP